MQQKSLQTSLGKQTLYIEFYLCIMAISFKTPNIESSSIGFARCPFMPAFFTISTSSSKAFAVHHLNKSFNNRKTKPTSNLIACSSFICLFKWVKHFINKAFFYTYSIILHFYFNIIISFFILHFL